MVYIYQSEVKSQKSKVRSQNVTGANKPKLCHP